MREREAIGEVSLSAASLLLVDSSQMIPSHFTEENLEGNNVLFMFSNLSFVPSSYRDFLEAVLLQSF
jgi:hypothetical protein